MPIFVKSRSEMCHLHIKNHNNKNQQGARTTTTPHNVPLSPFLLWRVCRSDCEFRLMFTFNYL